MAASGSHRDVAALTADLFQKAAASYETRMGGSTRAVAAHLVQLLQPVGPQATVLDSAAGTGEFTDELLKATTSDAVARVHAVDGSQAMVKMIEGRALGKRVETAVMDGQHLGFADGTFDISVTNFGIFFFPSPEAGAKEIYRTLKPGGSAVLTCWKEIGLIPMFYEAQKIVKPQTSLESIPGLEDWRDVEMMKKTLKAGGFEDIKILEYTCAIKTNGNDELAQVLTLHFNSFAGDGWSQEEKARTTGAAERLLAEQEQLFLVDKTTGHKKVNMVAWIAMTNKDA